MRYIAEHVKGSDYRVFGIKTLQTVDKEDIEVIVDSKVNNLRKMEEALEFYKQEKLSVIEKYDADIADMEAMISAIKNVKGN